MKKFVISLTAFFLPAVTFAQSFDPITTFVGQVQTIVNITIPIAVALAVLFFFWGLAQYILASGSDESRAEGRNKMIWGVVALFVIVSIWGIVGFLGGLLGIGQGGKTDVPGVDDTTGGEGAPPAQINPTG